MKLLITGATGFIGMGLLHIMREQYPQLCKDAVLLSSCPVEGFLCVTHKNYCVKKEDFLQAGVTHIDVVLHMGAYIPKNQQQANDRENCNANIFSTQYLVNNLPNIPQHFIFFSTVDVYAKNAILPITEETLISPETLYGWSKVYCEQLLRVWQEETGCPVSILRIGHIYGRGEEAYQKLIPTTIQNLLLQKDITLYTTGQERRAFLHVQDCCALILKWILKEEPLQHPINIVAKNAKPVEEWVRLLADIAQTKSNIVFSEKPVQGRDLYFDNTKMTQLFGEEEVAIHDGLLDEYHYFKEEMGDKNAE